MFYDMRSMRFIKKKIYEYIPYSNTVINNIKNKFAIPFGDFANRLLTVVNKSKSLTGRLDVEDVNPELGMAVFVVKMGSPAKFRV